MPHRPGVDIGDRCLIEGVQPDHVPPVPEPILLRQNRVTLSSLLSTLSSPLCLPSHPPQPTDSTVRPGPGASTASRPKTVTVPTTAGADSPPDCSHPKIWDVPPHSNSLTFVATRTIVTRRKTLFGHSNPDACSKTGNLPEYLLVSLAGTASMRLVVSRCPEQER